MIGPCLNAGGRLKSAKVALRMLLAEDPERAGEMADELKELNDMRKDMTAKGEAEAIEQVEKQYMDLAIERKIILKQMEDQTQIYAA